MGHLFLDILQITIPAIAITVPAWIAYRKEIKLRKLAIELKKQKTELEEARLKLNVMDKLLDFASFNEIRDSVERMFSNSKVDRFLILFAINGITDFSYVSVIFEQHKTAKYKVNAITRYRNVHIDDEYKRMLKQMEIDGPVIMETTAMSEQILKDFYTLEKVKHSQMHFLHRKHIDENNDVIVFSTVATHNSASFTNLDNAVIKTEYEGTISRVLNEHL